MTGAGAISVLFFLGHPVEHSLLSFDDVPNILGLYNIKYKGLIIVRYEML